MEILYSTKQNVFFFEPSQMCRKKIDRKIKQNLKILTLSQARNSNGLFQRDYMKAVVHFSNEAKHRTTPHNVHCVMPHFLCFEIAVTLFVHFIPAKAE